MSKRNRPTTAAQAAHRSLRHAYRSAYNSPEGKAARAAAAGKPPTAAKLAAMKRAVGAASPTPAPKTTTQG